jgi:phenylacetate-CoA ligase
MFVTPTQVAEVVKRHPQIKKGRLVVDRQADNDTMTLYCETEAEGSPDLANDIAASLRDVCKLRGDVAFAAIGSLATDGKVIDDIRKYD